MLAQSIAIRTSSSARRSTLMFGSAVHRARASASRSQIGSREASTFLPGGASTPIETDEALSTSSWSATGEPSETDRDRSRPTSVGGVRLPAPPPGFLLNFQPVANYPPRPLPKYCPSSAQTAAPAHPTGAPLMQRRPARDARSAWSSRCRSGQAAPERL
jgi:hypothetical protein